jgi:hypothetical protein
MGVGVNPPKTPITKGSNGVAAATLPNICKMPGPPAPFVPTPLPNIGKSGDSPKGYTKKVKIESNSVAIKGASFKSVGDMSSKGTGGGIVSANAHGPCKFISPGSMDVKFEGQNVHLLSDLMTNNGGGSGIPANSATMMGLIQLIAAAMITESTHTACPGGSDHQWVQITPSGSKSLDDKISDLKASTSGGTRSEGLAAEHNKNVAKNLQNSADLTEGDEQIRMMCNVNGCAYNTNDGASPEHDHNTIDDDGTRNIVEVKSNPVFDARAAKQMGRNFQAVDQGISDGVTMKFPKGPKYAWAVHWARKVAQGLGKPLRIVRF